MAKNTEKTTEDTGRDRLDLNVLAEQYNFAAQTINDDDSLKQLFQWATRQGPDLPDAAFVAKLKTTTWWKDHSASWKKAWSAERTGDLTWKEETLPKERDRVILAANNLGVNINEQQATALAKLSLYSAGNQWDDSTLASKLITGTKGTGKFQGMDIGAAATFAGATGQEQFATGTDFNRVMAGLKRTAEANGLSKTDAWFKRMTSRILNPQDAFTADEVYGILTDEAKKKYGSLADQIGSYTTVDGESGYTTVRDAADDYIATLSQIWDIDKKNIKLNDPVLNQALRYGDPKNPTTMPYWELEQKAREDERWLDSNEGQKFWGSLADDISRQLGTV